MQNHNHVLMSLEMEFKRMDRMFATGEMRVFGNGLLTHHFLCFTLFFLFSLANQYIQDEILNESFVSLMLFVVNKLIQLAIILLWKILLIYRKLFLEKNNQILINVRTILLDDGKAHCNNLERIMKSNMYINKTWKTFIKRKSD